MLTSLKIISGDMCDRNGIKSKVSTFEELYDFYFCTVNIVTLCGGNVYSNVFDTAVKADVFGDTFSDCRNHSYH